MKENRINKLVGVTFYLLILIATLFMFTDTVYADLKEDFQEKTADITSDSSNLIKPVSKITFQDYYYSNHSGNPYCFENSEGRCLDKEYNLFTTIEGQGKFDNTFYLFYKTELNEDGQLRLKKGYGVLKTGIWSWEVGKDTVWMGPGYHNSLLLSNNAEGFLLVRVRTEEPFRLPWFLSNLGEFKYDLFRGWSDNSSLLGHRLSWRPMPLLEFGANQVVYIPEGKDYQIYEYPHIFVSSNENSFTSVQKGAYDNDQKASIDVALDMPFLSKISPFVNGRLYGEYGGNDSYAIWQKEDRDQMQKEPTWKKLRWPFQFDFLNVGWLTGLFLTTGDIDFRFEYAQDYSSYPIFFDLYQEYGNANRRQNPWYTDLNYRFGSVMGAAMGNYADDYYYELAIRQNPIHLKIYFDKQRHDLSQDGGPPELRYQYGLRPSYQFKQFTILADFIYNQYRNVNYNTDGTNFDIHPGTTLDEYIAGFGVEINF